MGARLTPLAVFVAVLAAVLAGAGVVSAVVYEDDDDRPSAAALDVAEVTTTTTSVTLPETTTSTTAAPPETTTSSPPTTTARTTTTRRTTTTTVRRTTTTTTTATGSPALCAAEQIEVSGRPERLEYRAGQPVTLRTTIRNRSSSPCSYRGYSVTMTFLDRPSGATIIASSVVADDREDRPFAPGASLSHSATWDPGRCPTPPCTPPEPGIYSTQADWRFSGGRYTTTQDFVLR